MACLRRAHRIPAGRCRHKPLVRGILGVRRNGYPIGIVGRLGGFLLVGMLGSTALAAPALARNQPRDRDEQKPSLSISVEVGAVKVAADAQAPTADDPDASVSVSAPAVSASVSVDSSAPAASVDVAVPTGSASVAVNAGSAPAVRAAVRSASPAPLQPVRVDGVDTRRAAEPKSHPLPAAAREAPPAVIAAPPVGLVATPARVHPVPAMPKPRPTVRHKALFGQSRHPVTRPRQPREPLSPSVVRSDRVPAVSVFSERPLVSLLDTPRSAFSTPAAPAEAALAPAGRDWLRNASDLFGRSGAALGAGSAALLLFALVTAFALAAPRRGLWPRPLVELAPQPALPSLLERPG
jgi:hypothetical protein